MVVELNTNETVMVVVLIATLAFVSFMGGVASILRLTEPVVSKSEDDSLSGILRGISDANSTRHSDNLHRRIIKQMEELGEASEAYLNVTSAANGKNLSWADVREELCDQVIVAVDCALTPMPDQVGLTREEVEQEVALVVERKLAKWKRNRDTGKAATDAE